MGQVRITGRRINKIHRKAVAVAALQAFGALIVPSADGEDARHLMLQRFERHENLFLTEGRWDAAYVPLQIQRQPFSLIPRPDEAAAGRL